MRLDDLVARVERGLAEPLPGSRAQVLMAPVPRPGWEPGRLSSDAKTAAGLVLLYPGEEGASDACVLLTERTRRLPTHGGQISLPGGRVDGDETIEQAALREANEEVGLDPDAVRVLGRLSPMYIPVSRFNLYPIVGVVRERPEWRPHAGEVERVIETPIERLVDRARLRWERRSTQWGVLDIPYVDLDGVRLWGATGMVLAEFLAVVGLPPDPGAPPPPDRAQGSGP
jgi:8-oxo-dGTP pyrophosphatase MutT (NUDIX family)